MLHRLAHRLDSGIDRISRSLLLLSGILILLMAFAQTYGVIMRYVFNSPASSAYELSMLFLLFCGVLSVAGVEKLDQHVRNDLVSSRFSPRIDMVIVKTIFPILALVFCVILTWKSLDNALYALDIGQVTQSPWALPLGPIKLVICFGYILLCLVLLSKIVHGAYGLINERNKKKKNGAVKL